MDFIIVLFFCESQDHSTCRAVGQRAAISTDFESCKVEAWEDLPIIAEALDAQDVTVPVIATQCQPAPKKDEVEI